ncbi:hypothetical protein VP01_1465g2, partial [Puccinia sorghi]
SAYTFTSCSCLFPFQALYPQGVVPQHELKSNKKKTSWASQSLHQRLVRHAPCPRSLKLQSNTNHPAPLGHLKKFISTLLDPLIQCHTRSINISLQWSMGILDFALPFLWSANLTCTETSLILWMFKPKDLATIHQLYTLTAKHTIRQTFSDAYTPQKNGLAKCFNQTILESLRTFLLLDSVFTRHLWSEVLSASTLTLNQIPSHQSNKSLTSCSKSNQFPSSFFILLGIRLHLLRFK